MYRGDGSYKEHEIEISLLEVMKMEQEAVNEVNDAQRAFAASKNSTIKQAEYIKDIREAQQKLKRVREEMRAYFEKNLWQGQNGRSEQGNQGLNGQSRVSSMGYRTNNNNDEIDREQFIESLYNEV